MLSIYGYNFTSGARGYRCEDYVIPFCTSSHIEIYYVTCYSTNIVPSPTECESSICTCAFICVSACV